MLDHKNIAHLRTTLILMTSDDSNSGPLQTTLDHSGQLRMTPDGSRRLPIAPNNAGWTYLPESDPKISELDRSRQRIFASFTHHYCTMQYDTHAADRDGRDGAKQSAFCNYIVSKYTWMILYYVEHNVNLKKKPLTVSLKNISMELVHLYRK